MVREIDEIRLNIDNLRLQIYEQENLLNEKLKLKDAFDRVFYSPELLQNLKTEITLFENQTS